MPHVIVKMYAGRADAEKQDLANRITAVVKAALGHDDDAVSVAIEEVKPENWMSEVYAPDIEGKVHQLFKRPGYGPLR